MSALESHQHKEEARAKRRQAKRIPKMKMSGKGMKRKLAGTAKLH